MTNRCFAVALFCVSAALLGYELLLIRLLSLAQWGHFAGFVISIAMLGLAASGLFLHWFRERVAASPTAYFGFSAGAFGLAAPLAFAVSQWIPFTPYLLAWMPKEYLYLALRILVFFLPFFFGGIAIGAPFVARVLPASRLYFWSMAGSAAPGLPLFLGMMVLHPRLLLMPVVVFAMIAVAITLPRPRNRILLIGMGGLVCLGIYSLPFRFSPYKDLSKTLTLPESRILQEYPSPKGLVQTVQSPFTRYLPGLSLNFTGTLPPAELLFLDGSSMEAVFAAEASLKHPEFLQMSPEAFSYHLQPKPRVALLDGDAASVLRGLANQAAEIVVVDDTGVRLPAMDQAWRRSGFSPFQSNQVSVAADDARHFLHTTSQSFEVIALSLLGSHGTSTAGAASLDPNYLLTVPGLGLMLDRLAPTGHAVLTAWVENPARAGVRLAALVMEVLRKRGVAEPGRHILAVRSWSTVAFFVAKRPYPEKAVEQLKDFAEKNSFDLVHYHGIKTDEVNQVNALPNEPYYAAFQSLLGPNDGEFRRRSPFDISPPTDNHPFFNHFFRWQAVPEFMATMGTDWIPFVEWGYLLQAASLAVAASLGLVLLVVPCFVTRGRPSLRLVSLYFLLGVAYMFVEIWAIYKLDLLVSHPALSSTIVLTAMLAASGAGAVGLTCNKARHWSPLAKLGLLVAVLLISVLMFTPLQALVYPQAVVLRCLAAALWIALPAFFMGFPFPFALDQIERPEVIPWALAMNGLGSVLGSLAATLVAVHWGLSALALSAVALYAFVTVILPKANSSLR